MSTVAIRKEVIRWAMKRSGLTLQVLEQKFPRIQHWVTGEKQPTLRQVESLAKATLTPLGYFFLAEPPEDWLPIKHFRTLGDEGVTRPSADLLETVHTMQQRQAWMREFLIEEGQEPLSFVRTSKIEENPQAVADKIRSALGFDVGWAANQPTWSDALRSLREAIEAAGVLVVVNGIVGNNTHRKLDSSEFRGFVLVDEYAPVVFVNGADFKAAQMFTFAHELAHVFFGSSAAFDLRDMMPANDRTEQACNWVAAEFLVPEHELRHIWPSVKEDSEPFQSIARRFKVSVIVAARRAFDLTLINKKAFLEFYRDYQSTEHRVAARRSEGGDFYANQNLRVGRRFATTVLRATTEGKMLYSEAYRLTGLYGKTFERYTSSLVAGEPK